MKMIFWVSADVFNSDRLTHVLEKIEQDTALTCRGFISSTEEEKPELIERLEPMFQGKLFLWLQFPDTLAGAHFVPSQ